MVSNPVKPVNWIASSYKDFRAFPDAVQDKMGYALYQAQIGEKHASAKPLKGFGGAGVLEIVTDHVCDTFRTVYTVKFALAVYVLHAFQKKSKSGIATPTSGVDPKAACRTSASAVTPRSDTQLSLRSCESL